MENLIQKAILKALELHDGQARKGDGKIPYVVHAIEVGIRLTMLTNDEKLIAAAILHDTIEDGDYTAEELKKDFGSEVADLVACLSEDKSIADWLERKKENVARLRECKAAYYIKVIDAIVNMRDLVKALGEEGESVWERFNAGKEDKIIYYHAILNDMQEDLPAKLVHEYVALLKDLEYSALWAPQHPVLLPVI